MKRIMLLVLFSLWVVSGGAWADDSKAEIERLKQENQALKQRVEGLESSLQEIKQMLSNQSAAPAAAAAEKPAIRSKYGAELYGYVKLDASYDSAQTEIGNYALYVPSEQTKDDDDRFNLTARQSRFGLNLDGPEFGGGKTSGKVEIDFYEGGTENKNRIMMRQAYLKLDWPEYDFNILAGQTWDIINPLIPNTLNYVAGGYSGEIGYRRPQIQLNKGFEVGEDSRLLLQLAAARTIGDTGPFGAGDTGEDAGFPSFQGRTALSFPGLAGRQTTIGISGHYGQEEYDYNAKGDNEDLDTWSANLDLVVPLAPWLTLSGTLWTGENLDSYLGGIGQGMVIQTDAGQYVNAKGVTGNFLDAKEIEGTGGWAQLGIVPAKRWQLNLGGGLEDLDDDDLPVGARSRNQSYWANAIFDVNEAVQLGLELSWFETDYEDQDEGDAFRIQTSLVYKF